MYTRALCSVHCSSSSCLMLCHGRLEVPADMQQSFSVCLYKGKGDALDRGNYRGLELTEQAMKVIERIAYSRQVVTIYWSTLGGLYADALDIIADSIGECVRRLLTWKEGMER